MSPASRHASKKPASKKPASKKPASKKPASKKPASKKPASKKPASKKPASKKPASKKPASKKPASKGPGNPGVSPAVLAALNAEIEGFNDKRVMNSDADVGDWVITALRVENQVAIVVANDKLGEVSLKVPVVYEVIEASGRVDPQFSIDLMEALYDADQDRMEASSEEEPQNDIDPLEAQAAELLKRGEAVKLAALVSRNCERNWLDVLIASLDEPWAEELFANIADLDALNLTEQLFLAAALANQPVLLRRTAGLLTKEQLRPYGPVRATVRGWKMRGELEPANRAMALIGE